MSAGFARLALAGTCLATVLAISPAARAGFDWTPPPSAPVPAAATPVPMDVTQGALAEAAADAPTMKAVPPGPVDSFMLDAPDAPAGDEVAPVAPAAEISTNPLMKAPLPPAQTLGQMPVAAPAAFAAAPLSEAPLPPPVRMMAPPVAPSFSSYETVSGFGNDIPLALAMQQIVPPSFSYSFDTGVDPGAKVNWKGGKAWDAVLSEAVAPYGLTVRVAGSTVWVLDSARIGRNMAAMASVPVVPAPPAPLMNTSAPTPAGSRMPAGGNMMMDAPAAPVDDMTSPLGNAPLSVMVPNGPGDDGMMVPPAPPLPQDASEAGFVSKYPPNNLAGIAPPPVAPDADMRPRVIAPLTAAQIRGDDYHPSYPRRNPVPFYSKSEAAYYGGMPVAATPFAAQPAMPVAPPAAAMPVPMVPPGPSGMVLPPSTFPNLAPQPLAPPPVTPGGDDRMVNVYTAPGGNMVYAAPGAPMPLAPAAVPVAPPAAPAMPVAVAPPPAPPLVMAPADGGMRSVLRPNEVGYWQAAPGASLKDTLSSWSAEAGVSLLWSADRDFHMPSEVGMHGTYPDAVTQTLMAFSDAHPQPVAQLYPNLPQGPSVLIVKTR